MYNITKSHGRLHALAFIILHVSVVVYMYMGRTVAVRNIILGRIGWGGEQCDKCSGEFVCATCKWVGGGFPGAKGMQTVSIFITAVVSTCTCIVEPSLQL